MIRFKFKGPRVASKEEQYQRFLDIFGYEKCINPILENPIKLKIISKKEFDKIKFQFTEPSETIISSCRGFLGYKTPRL